MTFIAIIAYHIFQQLRHTKLWMKVPKPKFKKRNTKQTVNNLNNDTTGFVNIDRLREPWLEDLSQPTHTSYWALYILVIVSCDMLLAL